MELIFHSTKNIQKIRAGRKSVQIPLLLSTYFFWQIIFAVQSSKMSVLAYTRVLLTFSSCLHQA